NNFVKTKLTNNDFLIRKNQKQIDEFSSIFAVLTELCSRQGKSKVKENEIDAHSRIGMHQIGMARSLLTQYTRPDSSLELTNGCKIQPEQL
ncbi:MAG: hypothetical protein ACPGYX_06795, partial [Oceanobacter sp.]